MIARLQQLEPANGLDIMDISPPPSPTIYRPRMDSSKEAIIPYANMTHAFTPIGKRSVQTDDDHSSLFSDDDDIYDDSMRGASPPAIPSSIDDHMNEDVNSGSPIQSWSSQHDQPSTGLSFFTHHYGESPQGTPPELPIATSDDETPPPDNAASQRRSGTAAQNNESDGKVLNGSYSYKHSKTQY